MKKQQVLTALFEPYKSCNLCPLSALGRAQVVFGYGNADAKFMIIGEAPGAQEDTKGIPFVGRSGKFLTKTLESLGIKREDIYISNVVKCRPPNNRPPALNEISTCKKILLEKEIEIVAPKIICTVGMSALNALIPTKQPLGLLRGKLLYYKNILIFPTFHPAYILRNNKELEKFINDLKEAYQKSR